MPQRTASPTHNQPARDDNRGALIAGILLLLIGIYFLLERSGIVPNVRQSWPVILVIIGLSLVVAYLVNMRKSS